MSGARIVLAASNSESSEYQRSVWRQMLLATLPTGFDGFPYFMTTDVSWSNDRWPDGQAKYVPHGLRVVEALLLEAYSAADIAVCYPNELEQFVGDDTRVLGIHAHNPLGITFAAGVYAKLYGRHTESVNAAEFRRLILHPAIRAHKDHLKTIVGGPGAWQIESAGLQNEWQIDCLVKGEAESVVLPLFASALEGDPLPRVLDAPSPRLDEIPKIRHRSTFGTVEITRGCGRGCQFCSVALRKAKSIPLEQLLHNVRVQVAEGADTIFLVTEDMFLYEQGPRFEVNIPALRGLLEEVAAVPGVKYTMLSHATMAPVVRNPEIVDQLSVAVDTALGRHRTSTHPDKKYAMAFIGLETGSPRLFKTFMPGKGYPFRPEQWPDVVLKGMEILNRANWFPFCTWVIGLPGETAADTRQSLDLLYALKDAKCCMVPTLFVPLEDTPMAKRESARLVDLTDLQWEFFFTCWRHNLDFFRDTPGVQWKFNVGVPLYYYLLGRKLFGSGVKYPLLRLAHFPERLLARKLYLDYSGRRPARLQAPRRVEVPGREPHGYSSV